MSHEPDDPILIETTTQIGSLEAHYWHFGYVKEKNTTSVYFEWDDPAAAAAHDLPERLTIAEANARVKQHPFREKRSK